MKIITCNFCEVPYDMEKVPKPILIQSKGPVGRVHICKSCVLAATAICKQDLGPNWPKKKEPR